MHKMIVIITGVGIGCVIVLGFVFLHASFKNITKKISHQLYAWNMIPEPETFTELYFEHAEMLPVEILPQKHYSFTFTIHNLENKTMKYSYIAYLQTKQQKISLERGEQVLPQNQTKEITIAMSTTSAIPKSEVVVNLLRKQQAIGFWINQ